MIATGQVTRSLCPSRSPADDYRVLITQCLQRGFADPIGPHDPLPSLLPAGDSQAARLLGYLRPRPSALTGIICTMEAAALMAGAGL